ncbi:MAG: dicarboxylate/amino acid:cation symporter [Bacteroidales bacterium]|nr:dicarboxylate/amino acid:cation symporter [Bacteroidales bacterium]
MKKVALHWQILIALIIAIVYGIFFSTSYSITQKKLDKMQRSNKDSLLIAEMHQFKGQQWETKASFVKEMKETLGFDFYNKYSDDIIKSAYSNKPVKYISWMGDLFLRALKMLIIPLIFSSIISGVTNIGSGESLGRLGIKTIFYYVMTSTFAIVTGLLLVNLIKPGVGADLSLMQEVEEIGEYKDLPQILIEIVPENIFQAVTNSNMLSIIFFAILFGFFITRVGAKPRHTLKNFFNAVFDVMMKITMWVIRFTPLGILGIVAKVVADQDNLVELLSSMGIYMITVLGALIIHALITLPVLLRVIGKVNPFKHMSAMTTPILTAFSTSSSGATLPLTMTAAEENAGVSNKVTSFTLPLGATINMDGTALYECIAAMFIAQAYGIDLSITEQIVVVITALLASIGAAAIPMAGLVMITVILSAVGLPLEGVGLILAVDRILDMFRTATNVWSDSSGAAIIAASEGEQLKVGLKKH